MTNLQTKICTICKTEKPLSEFNRSKTGRLGHRAFCKSCQSIDGKIYYDKFEKVQPIYNSIPDLENEEWLTVIGYEGRYEISNLGRVKRVTHYITTKFEVIKLFNEQLLTPKKSGKSYLRVTLSKNDIKTQHYIALLVWDHFSKEPRKYGWQIDHIKNIRWNNAISNLQQIRPRLNSSKDRHPEAGYTGVTCKNGRYKANIKVGKKSLHLGTFDTAIEASRAYLTKVKEIEENNPEVINPQCQ